MTPAQLTTQVSQEITALMDSSTVPLTVTERQNLAAAIVNDVVGLGPIDQFLADPDVSEIMVNSLDYIYVERHGVIERTDAQFMSVEHLRRVVERIVGDVGRRIDEASPMVDARLPDGSRVNAIVPPLAVDGPALTIRKFAADPFQVGDLIGFGTLTPELADLLDAVVRAGFERPGLRRDRHRQDDSVERVVEFHSRRRADRHDRRRRRAATSPATRDPARESTAQHRRTR